MHRTRLIHDTEVVLHRPVEATLLRGYGNVGALLRTAGLILNVTEVALQCKSTCLSRMGATHKNRMHNCRHGRVVPSERLKLLLLIFFADTMPAGVIYHACVVQSGVRVFSRAISRSFATGASSSRANAFSPITRGVVAAGIH